MAQQIIARAAPGDAGMPVPEDTRIHRLHPHTAGNSAVVSLPVLGKMRSRSALPLRFDEDAYLTSFPDVALAIQLGEWATVREHLLSYGIQEGRLHDERYLQAIGCLPSGASSKPGAVSSIDTVVVSESGAVLIVGWIDDRESKLFSLAVFAGMEHGWNATTLVRTRRQDVDRTVGAQEGHLLGFWAVMQLDLPPDRRHPWTIKLRLNNGMYSVTEITPRFMTDHEARDLILGYIATVEYGGNRDIETFIALENGIGADLIAFNRRVSAGIVASAHVTHHGPARRNYRGSLIVCLFGRHEFMFLQSALFRPAPGSEEYEYIYVSNSPELSEVLDREAQISARIYGLSMVVVTLPGNAGFSAANNIAAQFARSDRIVIINPDVFPRSDDWAQRHSAIVECLPREQTALFGAPLYYDDGSLMHGGMYFETDNGMSIQRNAITTRALIRVEHYGKGAPSWSERYTRPRPVPAVSGAFMSLDRAWFEVLGGFSEDYLFGHYEDADLCLRSLARGRPAWLQDVRFWHMEGKGSTRLPPHEGGSLVNRWWFSHEWGETIEAGIAGPEPAHELLRPPPAAEASGPQQPKPRRHHA